MAIAQDLRYLIKEPSLAFDSIKNFRQILAYKTALHETFIRQEYLWLAKQARPGTTALDIGAFIADTSIYLAQYGHIKKVLAFEPNPSSYAEARRNIADSPFEGKIRLFNMGIGARKGYVRISGGVGLGYTKLESGDHGRRVKVRELDEVLRGLKGVIIKCDVEGAEVDVLADSALRNVYAIELEYHDTREKVVEILNSKGFRVSVRDDRAGVLYRSIGHICAVRHE
jgi:FkbM family methyltransferase